MRCIRIDKAFGGMKKKGSEKGGLAALAVLFFVPGRGRRERLTGENANIGTKLPAEGRRGIR